MDASAAMVWQDMLAYLLVFLAAAWLLYRAWPRAATPADAAGCHTSGCGSCGGCAGVTSEAVPVKVVHRQPG